MVEAFLSAQQSKPFAGILTTLYTATKLAAIFSSIVWCNQSSQPDNVRLSIGVGGAVDNLAQYLLFDEPIFPNDTSALTAGLTLATGDVLRCYSRNGNVSFSAFGVEIS